MYPDQSVSAVARARSVSPIGCAGSIAWSQRLPDGHFNLVLTGSHRYWILGEPPRPSHRLYRTVETERLDDPFPVGIGLVVQEGPRGQEESRRAVAALGRTQLGEGLLEGVEPARALEPLDRRDLVSL